MTVCDKCGKETKKFPFRNGVSIINTTKMSNKVYDYIYDLLTSNYDLCKECYEGLVKEIWSIIDFNKEK